jgi:cation diffusion facilitator CzcD-associated flavoprotein CzcO
MVMWREHMPRGMVLKSDGFASNLSAPVEGLTLEQYCAMTQRPYAHVGLRTPLQTLIDYATEFQRRFVGPVDESQIVEVRQKTGQFELETQDGQCVLAEKVIVASGLMGFRYLPNEIAQLPPQFGSHVSALQDPATFAGKRVIMVGGGQSALETSALLREAGADVLIVTRRPLFWFDPNQEEQDPSLWRRVRRPNFGLGPGWRTWFLSEAPRMFRFLPASYRANKAYTSFGPAGSGWLKHRVHGLIPVHTGNIRAVQAKGGEVRLELDDAWQTKTLTADHIIGATGYRPDVRRLHFLKQLLPAIATVASEQRGTALPVLDRGFQSSVPGLYFAGAITAATFGPPMRFIYGTRFTCAQMVPRLVPRQAAPLWPGYTRQPA